MRNQSKQRREVKKRVRFARSSEVNSRKFSKETDCAISERIWTGQASVYRFFAEASHADEMCRGEFLVSTLEKCRGYEDPRRGDKGEGELIYRMSGKGNGNEKDFVEMARRAGIDIGPNCLNISIGNAQRISRLHDGFVVCTTVRFSPKHMTKSYGKYCVEIFNAPYFFEIVDSELKKVSLKIKGKAGLVRYADRAFYGLEDPPGEIGFIKPKDQYSDDKEFRFLWETPGELAITPTIIHAPKLATVCRRIL